MFNFSFDKRIIYIILALIALSTIATYATQPGALLGLVLTLPGVVIAMTFHEFAHAYAADKLGDDTPRMQGRLNLNPANHIDPVGFLMLLFCHIGWGKPVQVNPRNYNRDISMDKAEAIVSVAGPAMNLILAIVFAFIYCALYKFADSAFLMGTVGDILQTVIFYTVIVNVGLGVFNLIPLPPLDGSKILKNFLPYNKKRWFEENENIFQIIFLVLWITGIAGNIISPIISWISSGVLNLAFMIFGL